MPHWGLDTIHPLDIEQYTKQGLVLARVSAVYQKSLCRIVTASLDIPAEVSGRFEFTSQSPNDYPVVGDFVAVSLHDNNKKAVIHVVLDRITLLERRKAGKRVEIQAMAANIDKAFIVASLDRHFNAKRIERFIIVTRASHIEPIVLLSKKDLCPESYWQTCVDAIRNLNKTVHIKTYSANDAADIETIAQLIKPEETICLLGSSGAGKSTLVNALLNQELLETQQVRRTDLKGRHTTTARHLLALKQGYVIDTPGMRELGLWEDEEGIEDTFSDIKHFAYHCKYRNCGHQNEPGCAVQKAITEHVITQERLNRFLKLKTENNASKIKTNLVKKAIQQKLERNAGTSFRKNRR